MKRVLSILSLITALCILLSCTVVGVTATSVQEPQPPFYVLYPFEMMVAGLPKTIQGQFDYDRDFIGIASEYPGYENRGFVFPLASEEYGSLYDVSYTVEDTLITYTYTLKNGVTFDDVLDAMDAVREAQGALPVSRESGAKHSFPIFNIVMKIDDASFMEFMAKVDDHKIIKVIDADGNELHENGRQDGDIVVWCPQKGLPDPNAPVTPTEATPTEVQVYSYRYKLLSQYCLSDSQLTEYDEIYEHKDNSGNTDWALVKAATQKQTSSLYTSPRYYEFGNRVMDTEYGGEPFSFDMGVYIAKYDRFFDVSAPELYELNGLERVWTEMGAGRLMGDMDGNNRLEVIDAVMIQRCQAELSDYPTEDQNIPTDWAQGAIGYFSDFDQDGKRTILDATAIQRYLANLQYRPAGWTPYPHNVQPTESSPTQSESTEPAPTEPVPTQPEPTQADSTEPVPQPTEPDIDPSVPRITGFKSTGFGVEISLSTVEGAQKYRVYYWSTANSKWMSMGETTGSTFIDNKVEVGSTYRYTVRCIKADLSAFTSDFYHPGWTYTYDPHLDTPKITRIEAADNGAKITWAPVEGADLYRVYYKHNGWTKIIDTRETSCVHTAITPAQTLVYTVRCLSQGGKDFASDYDHDGTSFHLEHTPYLRNMEAHLDGVSFIVDGINAPGNVAVYRKESSGWKRIGEVPSEATRFTDTDVQPGKTYTYTCRCLSKDGTYFISEFVNEGWSQKFTVDQCVPEMEFVIYDQDQNMPLVQVKENKFGIEKFAIDIVEVNDYLGTYLVGTEPAYLRGDFWKPGRFYFFYTVGLDKNDNVITSCKNDGEYINLLGAPSDLRAQKIGNREYRFSWTGSPYDLRRYYLNLIAEDEEYSFETDLLETTWVDVDLSDYPEDTVWIAYVWASYDSASASQVDYLEFKESDYQ